MFSVYILQSINKPRKIYIGFTGQNINDRLANHNQGKSSFTSRYRPWRIIYYEVYLSAKDARTREKMLKQYGSSLGHLKRRLKESLKFEKGGVGSMNVSSSRER